MTKTKSIRIVSPIEMPKHMTVGMGENAVAKNAIADVALVTVIAVTSSHLSQTLGVLDRLMDVKCPH